MKKQKFGHSKKKKKKFIIIEEFLSDIFFSLYFSRTMQNAPRSTNSRTNRFKLKYHKINRIQPFKKNKNFFLLKRYIHIFIYIYTYKSICLEEGKEGRKEYFFAFR